MSEQSLKSFARWTVGLWQIPFAGELGLIDLLLFMTAILMTVSEETVLLFHLLFVWLSVGSFFWSVRSFIWHALLWTSIATIGVVQAAAGGHVGSEELIEIPLLTIILLIVFVIARWRAHAQDKLDEVNRELARVNEKLTELDNLKNKFMADITHELRTPLTNLSLYIDLLKNGKNADQERYLSVIKKQSGQLVKITEDIISVSALALARDHWELAAIDLNKIMRNVVDSFASTIPDGGPKLVFDPDPTIMAVLGEADHLRLAITKIIDNAVKYTPTGLIRVTTWAQPEDRCVGLEIADTGIGISADDMPHIFERLYRGNNVGQSNIAGSGLGLTLARELIQLHNGFIDVTSDEGHGTVVRMLLPASGVKTKPLDETIVIRAGRLLQRPR